MDTLGASGISVQAPRRVDFLRAVTLTPLRSTDDLYWVARVTLLSGVEQVEPFDHAFDAWFRSLSAGEPRVVDEENDEIERDEAARSGTAGGVIGDRARRGNGTRGKS